MGSHRGGSAPARVENRGGGGVLWRTRRSGGRRGHAAGWEGVDSGTAKPEERTTRGGGGVLLGFLPLEVLDSRGGRSSDEMAPSRVFQAGQEATGVNEIPSAPLNRTDV
jgi:hypothetical protein